MADLSTKEILIAARKLIEKPENWGRLARRYRNNPHSCCVSESLEQVCAGPRGFNTSLFLFAARTFAKAADTPGPITDWNDAPGRTHAEVLAAFDRAIEAAR